MHLQVSLISLVNGIVPTRCVISMLCEGMRAIAFISSSCALSPYSDLLVASSRCPWERSRAGYKWGDNVFNHTSCILTMSWYHLVDVDLRRIHVGMIVLHVRILTASSDFLRLQSEIFWLVLTGHDRTTKSRVQHLLSL
jgi:hypothetical protein